MSFLSDVHNKYVNQKQTGKEENSRLFKDSERTNHSTEKKIIPHIKALILSFSELEKQGRVDIMGVQN